MASIKLRNPLPMILGFHKAMLQSARDNDMGENFTSLCEDTIDILSAMLSELDENRVVEFPIKQSDIKS